MNLPFDADGTTPRRVTDVARVGYEQLFRSDDGGYRFAYTGGFRGDEPGPGTDVHAANRGWVSITPLRLPHAAAIDPAIRGRLERRA